MRSPTQQLRLVVLPGDGVGPEVTAAALTVLEAVSEHAGIELIVKTEAVGGRAIEVCGDPLPQTTLAACRAADAVLLGAVGGPRWDGGAVRPEAGLLALRSGLGVFANLRPVRCWPGAEDNSPLREDIVRGADIVFIRELTGGAYFGRPHGIGGRPPHRRAVDTTEYSEGEIRRVAHVAFGIARSRRRRLTSVDKANVLATSGLWREVVSEVSAEYPDVQLEHCLVDSFALRMLQEPRSFDTVVTENLMGDILTDEAAALVGTLGILPSASGGGEGPWVYEPVHGSAPELAGRNLANPLGAIASIALLLRLSMRRADLAAALEDAIAGVVERGLVTADMRGTLTTEGVAQAVVTRLEAPATA